MYVCMSVCIYVCMHVCCNGFVRHRSQFHFSAVLSPKQQD
uniref:Uncharacterized protein n=1 Tax=Anguilla anguilla TaxID=7936 RepID=A0A0E9QEV2_ANGAN